MLAQHLRKQPRIENVDDTRVAIEPDQFPAQSVGWQIREIVLAIGDRNNGWFRRRAKSL
jgi:hypothetical protein